MFLKKAIAKVQRVCGVEKKTGANLPGPSAVINVPMVEEEEDNVQPKKPVEEKAPEEGFWLSEDVNRIRDQIENFIEENQNELTYAVGGAGVASLVFILLRLINRRPITKVKPGSEIEGLIIALGRDKVRLTKDLENLTQEREELRKECKKLLSSLINENKKLTKQQMMDAMSQMEEIVKKDIESNILPQPLESKTWLDWELVDSKGKKNKHEQGSRKS